MSRAPGVRQAIWIAIMGSALQSGCIHNHYYGTTATIPGCPPPDGTTVTTQLGSICDVPSGSPVVVTTPASTAPSTSTRSATLAASAGSSTVLISQPASGPPSIGQSSGRIKWRRPDPETLPAMKAEGALDETTIR